MLLSWLFRLQPPSKRLLGYIGLAVTGVLLVSWPRLASVMPANAIGDGLIALATVYAAAYVGLGIPPVACFGAHCYIQE